MIGHSVEARAERNTARSRGAVGVLIRFVNVCMVVEVLLFALVHGACELKQLNYLLHINDIVIVLRKVGTDESRIRCLVTRNLIALEDVRQTSDIDGEEAKGTAGGGSDRANEGTRHEAD